MTLPTPEDFVRQNACEDIDESDILSIIGWIENRDAQIAARLEELKNQECNRYAGRSCRVKEDCCRSCTIFFILTDELRGAP